MRRRISPARRRPAELENAKARFLGKSGRITEALKALGACPSGEEARGAQINVAKQQVEARCCRRAARLARRPSSRRSCARPRALDVTLPGRQRGTGRPAPGDAHHRSASRRSSARWVSTWPTAPRSRPTGQLHRAEQPGEPSARSMQDTFYVDMKDAEGRWLNLRTHTSPMQVRYARAHARAATRAGACPRSASSRRAAPTASTATRRTRRCSTSAKACGSARTSASRT